MSLRFLNVNWAPNKDHGRKQEANNKYESFTEEQRKKMREAYSAMGRKGGEARAQQLGHEGYVAMGRKGGEARARQMAGITSSPKK